MKPTKNELMEKFKNLPEPDFIPKFMLPLDQIKKAELALSMSWALMKIYEKYYDFE